MDIESLKRLFLKEKAIFLVVIAIQLIVQCYYYNRTVSQIGINEHGLMGFTTEYHYENVAFNYSNYNQFALGEYPDLRSETYRAPLWPFILGNAYRIFGLHLETGLIINNLFLLLSSVIMFLIGKRVFKNAGILIPIIFFVDPILIERANSNQSEISYMFLLSLCIYCLFLAFEGKFKLKYFLLSSMLFSMSTFTRPVTLYVTYAFSAVAICYCLFSGSKDKEMVLAVISFIVISIIPVEIWKYRNYKLSGSREFVGMKTVHIYNFLAPQALATTLGLDRQKAKELLNDRFIDNNEHFESLESEAERNEYKVKAGTRVLIENIGGFSKHYLAQIPKLFLSFPVRVPSLLYSKRENEKIVNIVSGNNSSLSDRLNKVKNLIQNGFFFYVIYIIFGKVFYLLNALSSFSGLVLMYVVNQKNSLKLPIIVLSAIYFNNVLMSCTWATGRLRVQILPIMAIGSTYMVSHLYNGISKLKGVDSINKQHR